MEKLYLELTKSTPKIDFDPINNSLVIQGQSYPENAFKFYDQVFSWIDRYLEECTSEIKIEISFSYINTSSSKCILMLLEKFEYAFQNSVRLRLIWYCNTENDCELECAEEFREDVSFPFTIIPVQDEN